MKRQILLLCVMLSRFMIIHSADKDSRNAYLPVLQYSALAVAPVLMGTSSESSFSPAPTPTDPFPLLDISLMNNTEIDLVQHMNADSFSALDMDKPSVKPANKFLMPFIGRSRRQSLSYDRTGMSPDQLLNLKMMARRQEQAVLPDIMFQPRTKPAKPGNEMKEWMEGPKVDPSQVIKKTFGLDPSVYNLYMRNKVVTKGNGAKKRTLSENPAAKDKLAKYVLKKRENEKKEESHDLRRRQTLEQIKTEQQLIQSLNNILEFIA